MKYESSKTKDELLNINVLLVTVRWNYQQRIYSKHSLFRIEGKGLLLKI